MMTPSKRPGYRTFAFHVLAISIALIFALPTLWVVAVSLRQPGMPPARTIEWLPNPIVWTNYIQVFELVPLGRYVFNSLLVAGLAVPLTLIIASWAAFAMAQLPPRLRYTLLALAVALRMVPITALWLTRFLVLKELHLIDTFAALLAPVWMGSSPFFVMILYWSFRRIPPALIDSARLDGLGALGIWARIALPLARPAIVAVGVLTFVQYWSDFINPLLYLKSEQRYTLSVGLRMLQQLDATNWPLLMAGVVIMMLPIMGLFVLVQRAFLAEGRIAGVYGN
jgi:multiple sugar transport system permease protein